MCKVQTVEWHSEERQEPSRLLILKTVTVKQTPRNVPTQCRELWLGFTYKLSVAKYLASCGHHL